MMNNLSTTVQVTGSIGQYIVQRRYGKGKEAGLLPENSSSTSRMVLKVTVPKAAAKQLLDASLATEGCAAVCARSKRREVINVAKPCRFRLSVYGFKKRLLGLSCDRCLALLRMILSPCVVSILREEADCKAKNAQLALDNYRTRRAILSENQVGLCLPRIL